MPSFTTGRRFTLFSAMSLIARSNESSGPRCSTWGFIGRRLETVLSVTALTAKVSSLISSLSLSSSLIDWDIDSRSPFAFLNLSNTDW